MIYVIRKKALGLLLLVGFILFYLIKGYYEARATYSQLTDCLDAAFEVRVIRMIEDTSPKENPLYRVIPNARIILIDDQTGEIIDSALTDIQGIWHTHIRINKDPRFRSKDLGTVTVIAIAEGYNELIHFNRPINEHSSIISGVTIILEPVNSKGRNEPSFINAEFHRFTVFDMLDNYAEQLGLRRQPIIQSGETPPWSIYKK